MRFDRETRTHIKPMLTVSQRKVVRRRYAEAPVGTETAKESLRRD